MKSIEIPRPRAGQDVSGVGKIYVEFMNNDGCNKGAVVHWYSDILENSLLYSLYNVL